MAVWVITTVLDRLYVWADILKLVGHVIVPSAPPEVLRIVMVISWPETGLVGVLMVKPFPSVAMTRKVFPVDTSKVIDAE